MFIAHTRLTGSVRAHPILVVVVLEPGIPEDRTDDATLRKVSNHKFSPHNSRPVSARSFASRATPGTAANSRQYGSQCGRRHSHASPVRCRPISRRSIYSGSCDTTQPLASAILPRKWAAARCAISLHLQDMVQATMAGPAAPRRLRKRIPRPDSGILQRSYGDWPGRSERKGRRAAICA